MAVAYDDAVCLFEITARDSFPCVEGPFERFPLTLLQSPLSCMALLPDCRLLCGGDGGEVTLYDFKSASATPLEPHGARVTCVALSHWSGQALVGSQDCVQRLWSLTPLLLDHTMEYEVRLMDSYIGSFGRCFHTCAQEHFAYLRMFLSATKPQFSANCC